jgi:hypothetical protein
MGVAAFWRQQLSELERRKQTYAASQGTLEQIHAIVKYCRAHNIDIEFIIPPEHEDVRDRIRSLGMLDSYAAFKSVVFGLGTTYDCDIPSDLTRNPANFQDPFHTTISVGALLTRNIWSGGHMWCDLKQAEELPKMSSNAE